MALTPFISSGRVRGRWQCSELSGIASPAPSPDTGGWRAAIPHHRGRRFAHFRHVFRLRLKQLCQAEFKTLGVTVTRDHDIVWLKIAIPSATNGGHFPRSSFKLTMPLALMPVIEQYPPKGFFRRPLAE
jgi:hypothetical protein